MSAHHIHTPSTLVTIIVGWLSSGYGWLFEDMPPISAMGAVAALALTLVKLYSIWKRNRSGSSTPVD